VIAEADSGEEGVPLYFSEHPDVVVVDLNMPGIGGLGTIQRILSRDPEARILVFSMYDNQVMVERALEAGVVGYLTKGSAPNNMVEAVRRVAAGEGYIDPVCVPAMVKSQRREGPFDILSPREFQVFQLLAEGRTVNDISAAFALSPKTVGTYHTAVMRKLKLRNLADLVRLAIRHGVVEA
jgi:two-component system invasion response regulator UvrY